MNQALREQTLERLKDGRLDILIATDVAARGLDVERISLVVNYDIPMDSESYVHRIGRTGFNVTQQTTLAVLNEQQRTASTTRTTGTADTVNVRLGIHRDVVVNNQADTLNVS